MIEGAKALPRGTRSRSTDVLPEQADANGYDFIL